MTEFTRLTIIGSTRKAELVIPDDQAIGGLLPRLMDLLDESAGSVARPLTLVRSTGEQLDVGLSAADQDVVDGELLRFVRADEAPPPPEVADVTDVLAESLRDRAGRWSDASRRLTGALALGVLGAVVASSVAVSPVATAVAVAVLLLVGVGLGRLGFSWGAVALTSAALGALLPLSWRLADAAAPGAPRVLTAVAVLGVLGWFALGVGFGIGLDRRPALWGGLIGVALFGSGLLMVIGGVSTAGAVAVASAVAVVVCGVLPRYAMSVSGLTGLDDQVLEGHLRGRDEVAGTVDDAYRSLTWSTFAVAVPLAAGASWLLALDGRWAVAAGALVVLVTALRTRSFPLAAQQMVLWFAVLAALLIGLMRQPGLDDGQVAGALVGLAVVAVVLVVARPAAHQRAFWRRTGNLVEAVAVIALVPVLLGFFGVYTDLLAAF